MEKLPDDKVIEQFQRIINGIITTRNGIDMKERWDNFEETMEKAAQVLREEKTESGRKQWYNEECKEDVAYRKESRTRMLEHNTMENRVEFESCRKSVEKICRRKKREYLKQKMESMVKHYMEKQARQVYREMEREKKGY